MLNTPNSSEWQSIHLSSCASFVSGVACEVIYTYITSARLFCGYVFDQEFVWLIFMATFLTALILVIMSFSLSLNLFSTVNSV